MSGLTYEVVTSGEGYVVTIHVHSRHVHEQVAALIGRPVTREEFPAGQPVWVARATVVHW